MSEQVDLLPEKKPFRAKLVQGYMRHVVVNDFCPKCGEETGTDCGVLELDDFPHEVGLYCPDCGDYEWTVILDISLTPCTSPSGR